MAAHDLGARAIDAHAGKEVQLVCGRESGGCFFFACSPSLLALGRYVPTVGQVWGTCKGKKKKKTPSAPVAYHTSNLWNLTGILYIPVRT